MSYWFFLFNSSKNECVEFCDSYYYEKICYDERPQGTKNINKNSYECFDVNVCKLTNLIIDEIKSISDILISLTSYSYTNIHVNYHESSLNKDESFFKELTNNKIIKIGESNKVLYLIFNSETSEKITINIPLEQYDNIDIESTEKFTKEGIDLFNIEDSFFNDLCFPYTSENGTDVTLSDRVENYYQNISLCDRDCNYEGVNYTTNKAICSCNIQEDILDDLLDDKLTGEVYEIVKSLNIQVVKCYDSIFKFENLVNNIGGWIMSGFLGGQIVMTVFFSKIGLNSIKEYLLDFIKSNPTKKKWR